MMVKMVTVMVEVVEVVENVDVVEMVGVWRMVVVLVKVAYTVAIVVFCGGENDGNSGNDGEGSGVGFMVNECPGQRNSLPSFFFY